MSDTARAATGFLWNLIRIPLLLALLALLPLVQILSAAGVLLGLFTATIFEISGVGPTFPFWKAVAVSLGFGAFGLAYAALLAFLAGDDR